MNMKEVGQLPEFHALMKRRWTVALVLTALTFITYYGFILVLGYSKATVAQKIGEVTTLGIPVAISVIIISFFLTLFYVIWANNTYDKLAAEIVSKMKKD
jgi:uncharacterized membrane protein (DUF485 family)